ncbi:MAG: ParB/RepB/Spo0J family partition protein [Deltaproteobacteria bacterium]|nr:ParB/RepB/Spo0J family partition protein [Deltaproteobacteria bacterium]
MSSQLSVPLSRLFPSKRNPRRVKPDREAHRRLVALIKAHGLLQPLVVRPSDDKAKDFQVIAGNRRLAALREIHRNNGDPKIPCVLRNVDQDTADALSLGENFGREPMHPLDEAEAFARLASQEGKGAAAIASEFGVTDRYVRQRMKLATLTESVKAAYRDRTIDTATAEAFASVPDDRQQAVWKELGGVPRHSEQVKNVIAHEWIDVELAQFDRSLIPESAISQDLFGERVLVERQAFLDAQANALITEQKALTEDGWSEVVVGRRQDVQDRLYSMDAVSKEFDGATTKKLVKIESDRRKLEAASEKIKEEDEPRFDRLQSRFEALDEKERVIVADAPACFSEETKARATVFLLLDPDGRVHREYRQPRRKPQTADRGNGYDDGGNGGIPNEAKPPSSNDVNDRQRATTFTHQALCVREALLKNASVRKRLLAMLLHDKVRSEAIALRHEANGTTVHATNMEGFQSPAFDRLRAVRAKFDPIVESQHVDDMQAFELLGKLSDKKLDALIDVLTVDLVMTHPQRSTPLVELLAAQLKVNVRDDWAPNTEWLGCFQKIQLAHLITDLLGSAHAPSLDRKKTELVDQLARLFADAATGKLNDKALADKLNAWLPANLRPEATNQ